MGCSSGKLHSKIQGQTQKDIAFLKANLNLTHEDLRVLLQAFRKIDIDGNNIVAFDEFCARIRCEPSYFIESVFSFFSSSNASCSMLTVGLNFAEFVLFCCFFLTLDEHGFVEYLFLILTDGDFNRSLLLKEDTFRIVNLQENIHHCFGNAWGKNEKKRSAVTWVFDHSHRVSGLGADGIITKEEFFNGCEKNKSLLFPAYSIQIDIRQKVVDPHFWKTMKGLGSKLLKRDIRKVRDALHKLEGRGQYHDNVDHHHRSIAMENKLLNSIQKDDAEANDRQRHEMTKQHQTSTAEHTNHHNNQHHGKQNGQQHGYEQHRNHHAHGYDSSNRYCEEQNEYVTTQPHHNHDYQNHDPHYITGYGSINATEEQKEYTAAHQHSHELHGTSHPYQPEQHGTSQQHQHEQHAVPEHHEVHKPHFPPRRNKALDQEHIDIQFD